MLARSIRGSSECAQNLNERQLLRDGRGHEDAGNPQGGEHVSGGVDHVGGVLPPPSAPIVTPPARARP
jgi:hypothetical protein